MAQEGEEQGIDIEEPLTDADKQQQKRGTSVLLKDPEFLKHMSVKFV